MNGIDVVFIVIGLLVLVAVYIYVEWSIADRKRRLERLARRGLA